MTHELPITPARLRELLDYDPETGEFRWRERPLSDFKDQRTTNWWNSKNAGNVAGYITKDEGYRVIGIDAVYYKAHRLAWLGMTGELPDEVDHINGDRADNRWSNLRRASRAENRQNLKVYKSNTSGVAGVYVCKDRRALAFRPYISVDGKRIWLPRCSSLEEAVAARDAAKAKYHPFQPVQRDRRETS